MRIAFLTPVWPASRAHNGIATYVDIMTRALRAKGHDCTILTIKPLGEGPFDDMVRIELPKRSAIQIAAEKLRYKAVGSRAYDYDFWGQALGDALARAHAKAPIDIFEAEESFGVARYAVARTPAPVVLRSHGPHYLVKQTAFDKNDMRRVEEEGRGFKSVDAASFPSSALAHSISEKYGPDVAPWHAYPNPIDLPGEKDCWRLDKCDRNTILFIGRFDRIKGADIALEAFRRLAEQFPDVRLVMAGLDRGVSVDGGPPENFETYIANRLSPSIRERIEFLGPVPREEVPVLRRAALVSISASRYETFPYAVTEALAMGAPVVSTATPGLSEYFTDGEDVMFAPIGDAVALADGIARLLQAPAEAARLGAAGRASAERLLSPDAVADQAIAFYKRVIEEKNQVLEAAPCS